MAAKRINNTTEAMYGEEPVGSSLPRLLGWYSATVDDKTKRTWAINYAKDLKLEDYKLLKNLPDYLFYSIGTLCRINGREGNAGLVDNNRVKQTLLTLIERAVAELAALPVEPPKRKLYKESLLYRDALGYIDVSVDNYIASNKAMTIESSMLVGLSTAEKNDISEYLNEFKAEMLTIKKKQVEPEEYSFGVAKANKLIKFFDEILLLLTVVKAPRKATVRKKKPVSITKLVAKLNFLQSSEEYGLNSIDVTKIIGAQRILVFNNKTRKVGFYQANTSDGLAVKGSTLIGFSPEASTQKTARKPLDVVPNLMKGAQNPVKKLFTNIKSVETQMNGRINKDVLILRVWAK